jgi:hypothetical protein
MMVLTLLTVPGCPNAAGRTEGAPPVDVLRRVLQQARAGR